MAKVIAFQLFCLVMTLGALFAVCYFVVFTDCNRTFVACLTFIVSIFVGIVVFVLGSGYFNKWFKD